MDSLIVWTYALLSWLPFYLSRPSKRSAARILMVVRTDIAIALLAPAVGLFTDIMWFYLIISALWFLNAFLQYKALNAFEEAEAIGERSNAQRTNRS